jgi:electron transport complex protein RnfA
MNAAAILEICTGSILVNNIVLARCIGVDPLSAAPHRLRDAAGMGLAATVVATIASAIAWIVNDVVLIPLGIQYLQLFAFVMIIASTTMLADLVLQKVHPALYDWAGSYLPALASNCVIIAAALMMVRGPGVAAFGSFGVAVVNGFATGAGYMVALVLMVAIQDRLEYADIPRPLRGLPVQILSLGLLSLAFLGFSGLHFFHVSGR